MVRHPEKQLFQAELVSIITTWMNSKGICIKRNFNAN
jgi:hypothetical protein